MKLGYCDCKSAKGYISYSLVRVDRQGLCYLCAHTALISVPDARLTSNEEVRERSSVSDWHREAKKKVSFTLTNKQDREDIIKNCAEMGLSAREASARFSVKYSTILKWYLASNLTETIKNKKVEQAKELMSKGLTRSQISKQMNVSIKTIQNWARL